ncbi:MAG: transporter [Rhodospirillales bacterium]|nr:transporter [Rhodospirillales bacterium]
MNEQLLRLVRLGVDVKREELSALLWSFAYFFSLLCGYFVLRPIRDEMGVASGPGMLPYLFTGTFFAMLCVIPFFGWLVKNFRRSQFIPYIYWFVIANLAIFWALFQLDIDKVYIARAFFIWTSVYNLFVVSVFWSFMTDIFKTDQGKRLFGFIAAGGTTGTILGPTVTIALAVDLGPANLMLVTAVLLAFASLCVRRLTRLAAAQAPDEREAEPDAVGGGILAGISEAVKSPYMLGICAFMLLYTTTSTVLYFQQADIVRAAFSDPGERTRVFAGMDLAVSTLTLLCQLLATGRLIKRFGVTPAIMALAAITAVGFAALALAPTMAVLIAFQIVRRSADYAIQVPSLNVLYTVVSREQRYKTKNFIDTAVFRGGDMASGWAYHGLVRLGLDIATIFWVCVPVAVVWMAVAWSLGRTQDKMAANSKEVPTAPQTGG